MPQCTSVATIYNYDWQTCKQGRSAVLHQEAISFKFPLIKILKMMPYLPNICTNFSAFPDFAA
jgi:hypothetical protein